MLKENGDIRQRYKVLYILVLLVGWSHVILGILGLIFFSIIEKSSVESTLFFYMIIAGYALLKIFSTVRKYEIRLNDLQTQKIINP